MIPRLLSIAGLLATALSVHAEDEQFPILKAGSEVYTNVTVTSSTATHIYFMHSRGIGNARLQDLSPALQKEFHFNPTNAAAASLQRAQANATYRQSLLVAAPPPSKPASPPPPAQSPPVNSPPNDGVPPHQVHARSVWGQAAPEIKVAKWLTAEPDTHGKFVLVDFWATWCGPCRQAIPHLNKLYEQFKDRLVVIGLSGETESAVRRMQSPRMDYFVAVDPEERTARELEVRGIPHAILIDPKGIVRFEGMPHYLDENNLPVLLAKYAN